MERVQIMKEIDTVALFLHGSVARPHGFFIFLYRSLASLLVQIVLSVLCMLVFRQVRRTARVGVSNGARSRCERRGLRGGRDEARVRHRIDERTRARDRSKNTQIITGLL
jgi:hypothetical protein